MALQESLTKYVKTSAVLCPFANAIKNMNDTDLKALQQAFDDGVSTLAITYALRDEGFKVSKDNVGAHRKKNCRCKQ